MAATTASLRPRLNAAWGAAISLGALALSLLGGAKGLSFVFALLAAGFLAFLSWRALSVWRTRLLWRLRNRLLVAYLFIAVIPIVLILSMAGLTAYLLYGQLAGYLIASDLESKVAQLGALNRGVAAELAPAAPAGPSDPRRLRTLLEHQQTNLEKGFAGLTMVLAVGDQSIVVPASPAPVACASAPPWAKGSFQGVISSGDGLFLHSLAPVSGWNDAVLCLSVPVTEGFLAQVGKEIGRFELVQFKEVSQRPRAGVTFLIGGRTYVPAGRLEAAGRSLPPPRHFLDLVVKSASNFEAVQWNAPSAERQAIPVVLTVETRPSLLNRHLFGRLGEVARALLTVLTAVGIVFLVLQLISLVTGVRLTRRITTAVADLYTATQRLQRGDLSVRVPRRRDDQLGALGESFNDMAAAIQRLLEESKEKQRLQNELEIARQVQEQLFPREAPRLNTLELIGRCRPARMVSGDYYDYGLAEPGRLLLSIGDISGKGISAALLMATIQSALRSQVYASRLEGGLARLSMAELAARVNRQLCATTSPEKFSSLFIAHYDDATRQLTYTNAGHLPPVVLGNGRTEQLSVGGPVVGLFGDMGYEQATVQLQPGDWLVAFTDGLTEVENSYEEQYGSERLLAFLQRTADSATPEWLIEAMLNELEQWAPGIEPADDCTLLVAHVR